MHWFHHRRYYWWHNVDGNPNGGVCMTHQDLLDAGSELEFIAMTQSGEIDKDPIVLARMLMWAGRRIQELENELRK